jgi:hypothetical protein
MGIYPKASLLKEEEKTTTAKLKSNNQSRREATLVRQINQQKQTAQVHK